MRWGMPIVKKIAKKLLGSTIKGQLSSAHKVLAGQVIDGKVIKRVVKGKGDWRYIIKEDDSVEMVTKDFINSLSRNIGTKGKMDEFFLKDKESRLVQAYKSLKLHKVKADPDMERVVSFHKDYRNQLKLTGAAQNEFVLAKTKEGYFTFPKRYADLLAKEKAIKIIKALK
jgi:hypothetical protein